jgi:hypothetical protein
MKINEQILTKLLKGKDINDFSVLYLEYMKIIKFSFNFSTFDSVEFLSLRNNQILNLNFIKAFPNLWYLDIRENQVCLIFIIFR